MRVLIVGATGLIGSNLIKSLSANNNEVIGTSRSGRGDSRSAISLDLENISESAQILRNAGKFDAVVLAAGISSVGVCHLEPVRSARINVEAQVDLAEMFIDLKCPRVIFLSTNRVFDGSRALVHVDEIHNPVTEYGRQKSRVEHELLQLGSAVKIVRFTKVLSEHSSILVDWTARLRRGESVSAFADVAISPITIEMATQILEEMITGEGSSLVQFSALDEISFFDMACAIAESTRAPLGNVHEQMAIEAGESAIAHSSLESSVFSLIKPTSSLHAVKQAVDKIT